MNIDWKTKLSSRKFWAGVVSFISAVLLAFNVDEMTTNQVITIVSGIGALVVYILAESYVDAKAAQNQIDWIEITPAEEADDTSDDEVKEDK